MSQSHRIARINAMLQAGRGVTMAQLREDLRVHRSTICRDLDFMRDQLNSPIVWDQRQGVYQLEEGTYAGPVTELPGLWFTPQQAYAFLTMQNMVEKIAPNLLGPFLYPIRVMLKEMLGKTDFQLYGLDKKIDIDMPAMPTLGDLDFSNLLEALVNDLAVRLTLVKPDGTRKAVEGMPVKLRIAPDRWVIEVRQEFGDKPLKIDVGQIQKVVLLSGEGQEDE